MIKDNLAIIPARAGSKGLKDKNIQLLNSRPLINWTIDAAVETAFFDKIVITTDSPEIVDIYSRYIDKRLILIKRPKHLCGDKVSLYPVIYHALMEVESMYVVRFKNIFTLQPTSPFRTHKDIKRAYTIYKKNRLASLLSVTGERHSIWKSKDESAVVESVREVYTNRQLVEPYYIANGAIFISKRQTIMMKKSRLANPVGVYVMDTESSVDIHTKEDLELAEYYLKRRTE